jgi:hypothetical protein
VDTKVTKKNLEEDFVLIEILWMIYQVLNCEMKEFAKLGFNLNIAI